MHKCRQIQILIRWIAITLFLQSCSSGQLQINSQPDNADVYMSSQSVPTKKLGVTPLVLNESQMGGTSEPYQLTISKAGFENSNTLIPATTLSRNVNLSVKLQELASNKNKSTDEYQKIASQVAQAQNLIKTKDLTQAEKNLLVMISQNPSIATYHELLGNVYYLKKDSQNALASYKKANDLMPGNPDTMRMINKLQSFNPSSNTDAKVNQ